MQLDALLQSINIFIEKELYDGIRVIYNTSSLDYEEGYSILKKRYVNSCRFVKEDTLKFQVYPALNYLRPFNWRKFIRNRKVFFPRSNFRKIVIDELHSSKAELTMFLTDDSVFTRKVELKEEWLQQIYSRPKETQFSLRLGESFMPQPVECNKCGELLSWRFSKNPANTSWGYPFSVDAHIYNTKSVLEVFNKCVFSNPSFLEGIVKDYASKHNLWNQGFSLLSPCVLSYPLNIVQDVANNESQNLSPQMMNDFFLKNYRIVYPKPLIIDAFQQYPDYIEFHNSISNKTKRVTLSKPVREKS